jgi:hypothetical protein
VDEDEDLPRGDEIPYAPWWTTEQGLARMRELEGQVDELDNELNRRRTCRK